MRNFKKVVLRVLFVLAFVVLFEQGFRFCYEPWNLRVRTSRLERTELKGTLDTVYVGTSLPARGFVPNTIDEVLGTNSFNLSTGSQPPMGSYYLVREAVEENPIQRVYFGLSISSLKTEYTNYEYISAYENLRTWKWRLRYLWDIGREPVTVSSLFYTTRVDSLYAPNAVRANVVNKWQGTKSSNYGSRGWKAYEVFFEGRPGKKNGYLNRWTGDEEIAHVQEEALEYIRKTAELCRENGIEFVLVFMPASQDYLKGAGDLNSLDRYLRELAEEMGAGLYNFTLLKDSASIFSNDQFEDYKHLNVDGAETFSRLFAEIIQSEDPQDYFLSSAE